MRQFAMSQHASTSDLYKNKAKYYKELFLMCAELLVEQGYLSYSSDAEVYYWGDTGERIDKGIN